MSPRKLLGALLLSLAVVVGVIGLLWALLASVGTEWDYCSGGSCTDGEVMALFLIVPAAVAGVAGFLFLRGRERG
jgi:hypothetical protein